MSTARPFAENALHPKSDTPANVGRGSVLLVIPWSPLLAGGVSTVVRNLHAHLPTANLRGSIVISDWSHKSAWRDEDGFLHLRFSAFASVRVTALVKALISGPATLLRLRRFLSETRPTVVNLHYPNVADLAAMALLKMFGQWRGRLVVSFHGTDVNTLKTPMQIALWRFGLTHADRITCCSRTLATAAVSVFGLPASRVTVAYNGVDRAVFTPAARHRQVTGHLLPNSYLTSVGSYIQLKGHRVLLEAFSIVADAYPSLHLVVVGRDGPERAPLLERAQRLGLASRVHCLVDLAPKDVAAVVAHAEACVQPSLTESFGLAVIEAAACGTPVVVSGIGGHLEIVDDGVSGVVFASEDVPACARALHTVLSDRDASSRMAATLLAKVHERFDWKRSVPMFFPP